MINDDAIVGYQTAMAVFKQWHNSGAISDDDLLQINVITANTYGFSNMQHLLRE